MYILCHHLIVGKENPCLPHMCHSISFSVMNKKLYSCLIFWCNCIKSDTDSCPRHQSGQGQCWTHVGWDMDGLSIAKWHKKSVMPYFSGRISRKITPSWHYWKRGIKSLTSIFTFPWIWITLSLQEWNLTFNDCGWILIHETHFTLTNN